LEKIINAAFGADKQTKVLLHESAGGFILGMIVFRSGS